MSGTKTLLCAAVLACAGILALAAPVSAQRWGHYNHSWGNHVSPGYGHSQYYGYHYPSSYGYYGSYYPRYYYPGYSSGYYPGYSSSYYSTYPSYSSYYNSSPTYVAPAYTPPAVTTYPSTTEYSTSYAAVPADKARVQIFLPNASGEVWVEGQKMGGNGTTRTFDTPALEQGRNYSYQITAAWQQDGQLATRERRVSFAPGQTVVVDFTQPD